METVFNEAVQTFREKISLDDTMSEFILGKYVSVPDYGHIHNAVEDLQTVLNAIPGRYLPLVIFIDDLDRYSPDKISMVIEGINLFLAGDFKDCIFIIAMDTEMVAAALEVAHRDVISKLPEYSAYTPIGWRFMDKFIQLPFTIAPRSKTEVEKFIQSLIISKQKANENIGGPKGNIAYMKSLGNDIKLKTSSGAIQPRLENGLVGQC